MAQVPGSLLPTWGTQMEFLALAWPSPGCHRRWRMEELSVSLPFK